MRSGFVYILASKRNGTLYTGITSDLAGRVRAHREGRGSSFATTHGVTRLVWFEEHALYTAAMQRETSIKRWKREWKLALIERPTPIGMTYFRRTKTQLRARTRARWVAGSSPAMVIRVEHNAQNKRGPASPPGLFRMQNIPDQNA